MLHIMDYILIPTPYYRLTQLWPCYSLPQHCLLLEVNLIPATPKPHPIIKVCPEPAICKPILTLVKLHPILQANPFPITPKACSILQPCCKPCFLQVNHALSLAKKNPDNIKKKHPYINSICSSGAS